MKKIILAALLGLGISVSYAQGEELLFTKIAINLCAASHGAGSFLTIPVAAYSRLMKAGDQISEEVPGTWPHRHKFYKAAGNYFCQMKRCDGPACPWESFDVKAEDSKHTLILLG